MHRLASTDVFLFSPFNLHIGNRPFVPVLPFTIFCFLAKISQSCAPYAHSSLSALLRYVQQFLNIRFYFIKDSNRMVLEDKKESRVAFYTFNFD